MLTWNSNHWTRKSRRNLFCLKKRMSFRNQTRWSHWRSRCRNLNLHCLNYRHSLLYHRRRRLPFFSTSRRSRSSTMAMRRRRVVRVGRMLCRSCREWPLPRRSGSRRTRRALGGSGLTSWFRGAGSLRCRTKIRRYQQLLVKMFSMRKCRSRRDKFGGDKFGGVMMIVWACF